MCPRWIEDKRLCIDQWNREKSESKVRSSVEVIPRKLSHGIEFIRANSPTRIWLKKEPRQLGPLIHTTWARTQVRLSIASFNKSIYLFSFLFLNNYCTGFSIKQKWNVIQTNQMNQGISLSHYILQHTVLIYCLIIKTRSVRLIKVLL